MIECHGGGQSNEYKELREASAQLQMSSSDDRTDGGVISAWMIAIDRWNYASRWSGHVLKRVSLPKKIDIPILASVLWKPMTRDITN